MDKNEYIKLMAVKFDGELPQAKKMVKEWFPEGKSIEYYQGVFDGLDLFITKNSKIKKDEYGFSLLCLLLRAAAKGKK